MHRLDANLDGRPPNFTGLDDSGLARRLDKAHAETDIKPLTFEEQTRQENRARARITQRAEKFL